MIALILPARLRARVRSPRVAGVIPYHYDPSRNIFRAETGLAGDPQAQVWVWAFKKGEARRYVGRFPRRDHRLPQGDHLLLGKRHLNPLRVRAWRGYLARYLFQVIKSGDACSQP